MRRHSARGALAAGALLCVLALEGAHGKDKVRRAPAHKHGAPAAQRARAAAILAVPLGLRPATAWTPVIC